MDWIEFRLYIHIKINILCVYTHKSRKVLIHYYNTTGIKKSGYRTYRDINNRNGLQRKPAQSTVCYIEVFGIKVLWTNSTGSGCSPVLTVHSNFPFTAAIFVSRESNKQKSRVVLCLFLLSYSSVVVWSMTSSTSQGYLDAVANSFVWVKFPIGAGPVWEQRRNW